MKNKDWLLLFQNTVKNRTEETSGKNAEETDALALAVLKKAIKAKYDINHQDGNEYTALAYAAEYNRISCVKRLLEEEDIDTSLYVGESDDSIGGAPIHIAAFKGHLEVIRALLDESPKDIELVEDCGYTPLHEAVLGAQYHAFKLLLKLGADEEALTGRSATRITPIGINTFQLIVYQGKTEENPVYKEMLEYLVLHKAAKGEELLGNVPDTDDEESFTMDSSEEEDEDEDDFESDDSECEDEDENHDDEFYVRQAMKQYHNEYREEEREKPWFFSAEKVLNKAEYPALKRSYHDAQIEYEIDKNEGYESNEFDSDSENEVDYKPKKIKFNKHFKSPPQGTELVLSARGEHFTRKELTQDQRKNYVKQSNDNLLAGRNIYSANTHQLAGVDFSLPETADPDREEKLKTEDKKTRSVIEKLKEEKNVAPVLQASSRGSRALYDNRLIEMIQRYVNSYHTFTQDIRAAQNKSSNIRGNNRTRLKKKIYQTLKGNPFISTSEDIEVGLQYAFAILNYDKKNSHRPASDKMKNITLTPRYRKNGELRHPYLGVIFITLHQREEIKKDSISVLDLFRRFKIDVKKTSPGSHESSGYVRALERIFFGGITSKNINIARVVRLPNFYHPYREEVVLEKYGLTEEQYNAYKNSLSQYGAIVSDSKKLKNSVAFYRTQEMIIQTVIKYQKEKMINELNDWALKHGVVLGSMNENGQFEVNINIDPNVKVKQAAAMLHLYKSSTSETEQNTKAYQAPTSQTNQLKI